MFTIKVPTSCSQSLPWWRWQGERRERTCKSKITAEGRDPDWNFKDWPDLKSSHFKIKPPVESVDDTAGPARPNDDVKDKAVCLWRRWCWWWGDRWWWWQSPYSDNDGDHHLVVTMMVMLMVAITWWFSSPNLALHPAIRLPSSSRTGSEIPMNEHGE